ncbi:MAG: M55 family metallopeptidase, partial [Clostridiales bacterium]|nr:M55 family metallopeptidase [Clostridiales bacterium]
MNILIMTDLEGISGIYDREQVTPSGYRFHEAREYMTADINVCVEACKEAGADKVYVRDCHGGSYTVIWEKLSPLADWCILGNTSTDRFAGLEDCDGVILLGYHAMAGTKGAFLEHSMSSASIQNYWINGNLAGETAIDAGIVG